MKVLSLISALLFCLVFSNAQASSEKEVPKDATAFNKHHYKYFKIECSWQEAVAKCAKMGGSLVSIKDQETDQFLAKLSQGQCYWAGASDKKKEGEWLWLDGSKVTYTNWAPDEPDNWRGGEHCLVIAWPSERFANGKWGDTKFHKKSQIKGFICQWPK
jgi:hypothetical protein